MISSDKLSKLGTITYHNFSKVISIYDERLAVFTILLGWTFSSFRFLFFFFSFFFFFFFFFFFRCVQ